MKKLQFLILPIIFHIVFLSPLVSYSEDDLNELAYQNRYLLRAGTILNDELKGDWRGIGDCLIFPYYDVRPLDRSIQTTTVRVKNISEYGIVARFRVRDWARGREVFSRDIWIPSSSLADDTAWEGTIEIKEDGKNALITSSDYVVTRNDTNSFSLDRSLSSGVPFSTRNIRKKNGDSTLYGSIEVIGEEKTSSQIVNGRVERLAKIERDCPNTMLGKGFVSRPEEGVTMAYDAVAIGNFSRGQGSLFRSIGNAFPRLDTCEDTLDQLEFQLSKWEIYAPYDLDPSSQGKTSLIITYPTKFFHYQNGTRLKRVNNPFEAVGETRGEILDEVLSEQGEPFMDSLMTLPYSVNVIGFYREYGGKPLGIHNAGIQTEFSEFGEVTVTADNLSERMLIADYEYYKEGRFTRYNGLPAVGLVLQESQGSGLFSATLTPVEYSTQWGASDIETITTPAMPAGPTSGIIETSYTYVAGGATSSFGHPLEYQFDWMGDGSTDLSDWGPEVQSKTWTAGGVFFVRVRARCAMDAAIVSKWSNGLIVTIESVSAPTYLSGPIEGIPNESYTYTAAGAFSNAGHALEYQFDWGDGNTSGWGSGTQSKAWTTGGSFKVKARARCATHTAVVSDWTPELEVTIELVSVPSTPIGPSLGDIGGSYSYSTGGSSSNLGHAVEYQFDWGDGTLSTWGPSTRTRTWTSLASLEIKARARCVAHQSVVSDWSSALTFDIESVSVPSPPTGPSSGTVGVSYSYSASGAISSSNHTLQYQFDWNGDGATDLSLWGGASRSKVWTNSGIYTVKVRARCSIHQTIVTAWSSGLVVVIESVSPPTTLTGPATGMIDQVYQFIVGGASSDRGDPVQYQIDWGDGSNSGWLPVGVISVGKTWTNPGTYTLKAQARCSIHTSVTSTWYAGMSTTITGLPPQPETISAPTTPVGPSLGDLGASYAFSTGGAISTLGHSVQYRFDWGDGTFSPWGLPAQSRSWSSYGAFEIKAQARCVTDPSIVSEWSSGLAFVIEMITTPGQPTGPLNGMRGQPNTYKVSGSASIVNDPIEYQFDWRGDGASDLSAWTPASPDPDLPTVMMASQQKIWTTSGTYTVRARARCATHPTIVTGWSPGLAVVIEFVSKPVTPTGVTSGAVGQGYPYTTGGSSSDRGDFVQYRFDWGDGSTSEWLPIGTTSVGKAWANPGTYAVKAQARCGIHTFVISEWSSALNVTILPGPPPQTETISTPFITSDGVISGRKNIPYTFSCQSGVSNLGHAVQHQFDWRGDGTDLSAWGEASKAWSISDTYMIRVRARCAQHPSVMSEWSSGVYVVIDYINAPSRPVWESPPAGNIGQRGIVYNFSTPGGSVSEIGQEIQYRIQWGDGNNSGWLAVGVTSATHAYISQGTYTVRVEARGWWYVSASDTTEHVSDPSPELMVTIRP